MSYPPAGKLLSTAGIIFMVTMPMAGLFLSPPDEYLRTLFILLSLVGAALYANGRLTQVFEQQHLVQVDKEWILALAKVLMWLSPILCATAVLSWILWRYGHCYHVTISGLSLILPAVALRHILFEGEKAQTKTV